MINTSSSVVPSVGGRQAVPQPYVSGQQASVGTVGPKPFVPMEFKPAGKVEVVSEVKVDKVALDDAVKKLNEFIAPSSSSVQFTVDQESNRTVVKVVDLETKQVIRQFPNEEVLSMSKALGKLQGLMIKQTA